MWRERALKILLVLAAANPQKVQKMKDLMFGECAKYQVVPLDGSASSRFVAPRPSQAAGRKDL